MGQLGDTLRERRKSLGISLEQAEEHTKIRGKLLDLLEKGDYERLPNPGYVRGYITSYARYLELDTVPLLAMYRAETGAGVYHEIVPPGEAVAPRNEQHDVPWRVGVIVVAVLAVLSFGIWATMRVRRGPEPPPPISSSATDVTTSTETPTQEGTTPESPAAQNPATTPAKYTPFTARVAVSANGASWIVVIVDGNRAYEGSITGGHHKDFEVTKKAVIKIGRPSVVTVYRDGKKMPIPRGGGTPSVTLTATPAP
jgi:cytoskeleton protein RodZ